MGPRATTLLYHGRGTFLRQQPVNSSSLHNKRPVPFHPSRSNIWRQRFLAFKPTIPYFCSMVLCRPLDRITERSPLPQWNPTGNSIIHLIGTSDIGQGLEDTKLAAIQGTEGRSTTVEPENETAARSEKTKKEGGGSIPHPLELAVTARLFLVFAEGPLVIDDRPGFLFCD